MSKIETNTIAPSTGTTLTIGESGDTVQLGTGATQSGFGGANTPAFEAYLSVDQTGLTENAFTKVQCDTEHFDTDNCYDNSTNYRFTPTVAGKYFVYGSVTCRAGNDNMATAQTNIYKNGSQYKRNVLFTKSSTVVIERIAFVTSAVIDMNGSSDYVELYGAISSVDGTRQFDNAAESTWFGAYKIIT